jgi:hypothetical protein
LGQPKNPSANDTPMNSATIVNALRINKSPRSQSSVPRNVNKVVVVADNQAGAWPGTRTPIARSVSRA